MKIIGTKAENYILIIAKAELFAETLSRIEKDYDDNIVRGVLDFLGFDETVSMCQVVKRVASNTKPIIFIKSLYKPSRKCEILYTRIIEETMSDIKCNSDYTNDDYTVIAPCSFSGSYIRSNFTFVSI